MGFCEMKNVSIATGLSAPSQLLSNKVLGNVAEPRLRWNLASLVASSLNVCEVASFVVLTPTLLFAHRSLAKVPTTLLDSTLEGLFKVMTCRPDSDRGRSRPLEVVGASYAIVPTHSGAASGYPVALLDMLLKPSPPILSISNVVDVALRFFEDPVLRGPAGEEYVIVIDQFDGQIHIYSADPGDIVNSGLYAIGENPAYNNLIGERVFAFEHSEVVPGAVAPGVVVPAWG